MPTAKLLKKTGGPWEARPSFERETRVSLLLLSGGHLCRVERLACEQADGERVARLLEVVWAVDQCAQPMPSSVTELGGFSWKEDFEGLAEAAEPIIQVLVVEAGEGKDPTEVLVAPLNVVPTFRPLKSPIVASSISG